MVFCNVYDLSPANDYGWSVGIGAFHSGIEVYGVEYSFGSGGGVFASTPKEAGGAKFREGIPLGEIFISERGIVYVVLRGGCVLSRRRKPASEWVRLRQLPLRFEPPSSALLTNAPCPESAQWHLVHACGY